MDISKLVKIEDGELRGDVESLVKQVFDRLPRKDLKVVIERLDSIYSAERFDEGVVLASTQGVDGKFKVTIYRDLFKSLSEKAKVGVLAHELRHIYRYAILGVLVEHVLGSEFEIDDDLTLEWGFGEEASALKRELEMLAGVRILMSQSSSSP